MYFLYYGCDFGVDCNICCILLFKYEVFKNCYKWVYCNFEFLFINFVFCGFDCFNKCRNEV